MKLLYAHTNNNDYFGPEGTFALLPPSKKDLHDCFLLHANQLMVMAGVSIKSKHDVFQKTTGRIKAEARVAPRVAELVKVDIHGTKHIYQFYLKTKIGFKDYTILYLLTTVAESDKVNLIKCEIYEY